MKHFIESARCEMSSPPVNECGFYCYPPLIVGEVKFKTDEGEIYYTLEEDDLPFCYRSPMSIFDVCIDEDPPEEAYKTIQQYSFDPGLEYDDILENESLPDYLQLKYLIYIVRSPRRECDAFIKETVGRFLEDIEIPSVEKYL